MSQPPDSAYWSPEDPRWAQVKRETERPGWFELAGTKLEELSFAIQDIPVEELPADNLDMLLSLCESLRLSLVLCRKCRDEYRESEET